MGIPQKLSVFIDVYVSEILETLFKRFLPFECVESLYMFVNKWSNMKERVRTKLAKKLACTVLIALASKKSSKL